MFASTSRYYGLPTAEHVTPDGRVVVHVRRRFLPDPEDLAVYGHHVVRPGERLDLVAAREFGDPEMDWRIADANRAVDPDALAEPGRRLALALPAGIPGGAGMFAAATPAVVVGLPPVPAAGVPGGA